MTHVANVPYTFGAIFHYRMNQASDQPRCILFTTFYYLLSLPRIWCSLERLVFIGRTSKRWRSRWRSLSAVSSSYPPCSLLDQIDDTPRST